MGVINAFPSGAPVQEYKNKVEITTSQEWTVPERVSEIRVTCVGGGAGGGGTSVMGSTYNRLGGAGGGGGYMTVKTLTVSPGNTYLITIGTGGIGEGVASSSSPTNGGNTTFGDEVIAQGGKAPQHSSAYSNCGGDGGTGGGASSNKDDLTGGIALGGRGQYGGNGGDALYNYGESNPFVRDGQSTDTAIGGKSFANTDSGALKVLACGGGGGVNGGDGGNAGMASSGGGGGGGGGYGSVKIATDGTNKYGQVMGSGGKGYGAGGGGGKDVYDNDTSKRTGGGGNGAPGICIVEY